MDYSDLAQHEIIRLMYDSNPSNKSTKQIAHILNLSLSTILKWAEPPDGSGSNIPSMYIIPLMMYCQDYRYLEWMAQQVGLRTVAIKPLKLNGKICDEIMNIDIQRGNLASSLKIFLEDGRLDAAERVDLRSHARTIIKECETFLEELSNSEVKFS